MLWLQTPPWGRWIAATLIVAVATWVELRPDPSVAHPFATVDIVAGEEVGDWNSELREVPAGLMGEVVLDGVALVDIAGGDPILASHLGPNDEGIPSGWWQFDTTVPQGADRGDEARVVLLDTSQSIEAVVAAVASEDPLGSGMGSVAVAPEHAAEVAAAAAEGRIAILVVTP